MGKSIPGYANKGHDLIKAIQKLGSRYSNWEIFQDFLALSAISISNCVDWNNSEKRESEYMQTIKKYKPDEQKQLAEMLTILITDLQREGNTNGPCDVLGEVFHGLELHNKYHGQFFTPFHICEFMGQITLDGSEKPEIEKKGYISVCEPCVGSGGMVLGLANAMFKNKLNYQQQLCVTACDIDIKCVHMAYLQLSLYGIPAIVIHGNSLSLEQWSAWYTPAYMLGMWILKERRNIKDVTTSTKEKTVSDESKIVSAPPEHNFDFKINKNGQMSLF